MLTVTQVAERLQLQRETIRRWARSGKLPSLIVGNRVRFRPEVVEKFAATRADCVNGEHQLRPQIPSVSSRASRFCHSDEKRSMNMDTQNVTSTVVSPSETRKSVVDRMNDEQQKAWDHVEENIVNLQSLHTSYKKAEGTFKTAFLKPSTDSDPSFGRCMARKEAADLPRDQGLGRTPTARITSV